MARARSNRIRGKSLNRRQLKMFENQLREAEQFRDDAARGNHTEDSLTEMIQRHSKEQIVMGFKIKSNALEHFYAMLRELLKSE